MWRIYCCTYHKHIREIRNLYGGHAHFMYYMLVTITQVQCSCCKTQNQMYVSQVQMYKPHLHSKYNFYRCGTLIRPKPTLYAFLMTFYRRIEHETKNSPKGGTSYNRLSRQVRGVAKGAWSTSWLPLYSNFCMWTKIEKNITEMNLIFSTKQSTPARWRGLVSVYHATGITSWLT